MKRICSFCLLTCLCTSYVTIKGMDFYDKDIVVDTTPTLTHLCTQTIVNKIDATIKEFHTRRLPVQSLIEYLNECHSSLHCIARDIVRNSFIAKHARRAYYCCDAYAQYYDGRVLSPIDRLNTPDPHATSPWNALELEDLIATYCTTYYAYKAHRPHPFAQIIDAQRAQQEEDIEKLELPGID